MKYTTLFTLIGYGLTSILSVSALPAPTLSSSASSLAPALHGHANTTISARSPSAGIEDQAQDIFGRHDQHILQRYFNHEVGMQISQRDWAEGTVEPLERSVSHPKGMSHQEYLESKLKSLQDSGLEEHNLGKRLYAAIARAVIKGVIKIIKLIKGKIEADKKKRAKWTGEMIGQFRAKYPHYNFVICHVKHHYSFKGQRGKDWGHSHQELPVSFHKTVGYEIYWFREGVFDRDGDGGWLNWSYSGNVKSATNKNSHIVFGRL
ncbi:hypothetical protein CPC08DRAFT_716591 [Agrocybe pediades]|nr:hypothetical protein CPC08DRAFT_716591 [Agrocybe pediades]